MAIKRSSQAKRWLTGFASVGAAALLAACGAETGPTAVDTAPEDPMVTEEPATDYSATGEDTIVDLAASSDEFSTLAQAVEAADLTEALSATGPITLFAPTNEAFEALPEGTLDELLLPENQDLLRQVLTYHVVQDEVAAADVTTGDVPTAAGTPLSLVVDETTGDVMVNNAMVVEPDIQASNGIIHGIDQVILPPDLAL
ncbi:fasciclin domain-containing protein [Nodosilinea sp. LEGE 07298]|uniref:fasciclin domain-containing protein n=1 Tax=Nodosilinea sp. LEGE 07298 TaxID=2777970 RepID=UPI0018828EC9|nr:fasciclin domain-containing protein [Nodosilinea sp. LEGE 07298]MBE9112615.1 fasciclin domain-containing protein [Nodosilinea sp. LEGE 07298]